MKSAVQPQDIVFNKLYLYNLLAIRKVESFYLAHEWSLIKMINKLTAQEIQMLIDRIEAKL